MTVILHVNRKRFPYEISEKSGFGFEEIKVDLETAQRWLRIKREGLDAIFQIKLIADRQLK